uniref:Serine/threonine-protein phosphatase CPPED1 n=1 Tax=Aceria tosichella TaxID=561515 RepID=A0A6G1SFZ4_9ACAR
MMMQKQDDQAQYELVQTQPIGRNPASRRHFLPGEQHEDHVEQVDINQSAPAFANWSGPFYFVQAADTQFGLIDRYIKKLEPVRWDEETRLSELFVDKCNNLTPRPKFVVVCGDLTDADPTESAKMRQQQVHEFKRIFSKLDRSIPLVCLCGNHDVGDEPTMELIANYKRDFGDDYFYFASGGVLFIVINSQFYKHREHVQDYAGQQDKWLVEVLKKCNQFKYSIVFEHIPWFLERPDEDDDYFNVDKPIRLEWLKRFQEAGVTKIMCGHYHRNAGGWFENMELVVTSAVGGQLGKDKSGARLVRVLNDSIEHKYYALEEMPEQVDGI